MRFDQEVNTVVKVIKINKHTVELEMDGNLYVLKQNDKLQLTLEQRVNF